MRIAPVDAAAWAQVETLFGAKGACGGCWCMYWHAPPGARAWEAAKGEANRRALKSLVESGRCVALLALEGDDPVGWCRLGPVESFDRLRRSRKLWRADMADWAVVCFYVKASHRRLGLSSRLLAAAVEYAFDRGARSIEGYAVVPKEGDVPAAFAWTGLPGTFERLGFEPVAHDSGSRRIYRLETPTACPDP